MQLATKTVPYGESFFLIGDLGKTMKPSQDVYKELVNYDSTRRNSVDVLNDALGKYGVPEIRGRVAGLRTSLTNTENSLNQVDPSVTGRTSGSLVTEAQRSKQVANERAPIMENYGSLSRGLSDAQANLTDQERAAQMLASGQQSDWEAGRSAISERYGLASAAEAEQRRREEADRAFNFEQQKARSASSASASAASQQAAIAELLRNAGNKTNSTTPLAQDEQDAQYLGRLKTLPDEERVQIIAGLRQGAKNGTGNNARLFELGKQLGYWKF